MCVSTGSTSYAKALYCIGWSTDHDNFTIVVLYIRLMRKIIGWDLSCHVLPVLAELNTSTPLPRLYFTLSVPTTLITFPSSSPFLEDLASDVLQGNARTYI